MFYLGIIVELEFEELIWESPRDGVARYDHVVNCVRVHVGNAFVRILIRNQIRPHADTVGTS